jgi:hypothetical protein
MSDLIMIAVAFAAGLVVGWIFLPEPAFVRNAFVQIGWAKAKV